MLKKLVGGILFTTFTFSQTTVNPQFSVIGDLVMDHLHKDPSLLSSGIEIAVQGYVNPFARADIYLHKHNDDSPIELEEAFFGKPIRGQGNFAQRVQLDLNYEDFQSEVIGYVYTNLN